MLKVYINCKSILLQKSLEIFLKNYKTSYKLCDVVISDRELKSEKKVLIIGSGSKNYIKKPFTKNSLMLALDREKERINLSKSSEKIETSRLDDSIDLELQIEKLTERFAKDLAKILRAGVK